MTATTPELAWGPDRAALTGLRGYLRVEALSFEETIARLRTLSGQDPTKIADGYKTSVEFGGTFGDEPFFLYDYKADREIHIGGSDRLDVAGLHAALVDALRTAVPTPYEAREAYDGNRTHGWPAR